MLELFCLEVKPSIDTLYNYWKLKGNQLLTGTTIVTVRTINKCSELFQRNSQARISQMQQRSKNNQLTYFEFRFWLY